MLPCLPLGCLRGLSSISRAALFLRPGNSKLVLRWRIGRGVGVLRESEKMLLRSILCEGVWNGFLLGSSLGMRRSHAVSVAV